MSKKRWPWKKKLMVSTLIVVALIGAAGFGAIPLLFYIHFMRPLLPRVYTFPSAAELTEEQRRQVERSARVIIPESATDIYIWSLIARDSSIYSRMSFPSGEEARRFAEEFANVPISKFRDGKTSDYDSVRGPTCREGKTLPWWNLGEIKRGKLYERFGLFIVIDLYTNTVYLSEWTM